MSAAEIAAALDGRRAGAWWLVRCPAHEDASPSLGLRDGARGLIANCFAGCSRDDVFAALRRLDLPIGGGPAPRPDPAEAPRRHEADERDRRRRVALALDIWRTSCPADATAVVPVYLGSRGILIPIPPTLRVHGPLGPYGRHPIGARRPQMVGLVKHVERGPVAVHRTFLTMDGSGKAALDPVRIINGPAGGGAVRLAPAAETLMIAEGIETALSAMQATGQPAWAALSTSGMAALVLPSEVREVIILADHDTSGAGERAAQKAAQRWLAEGRRVRIAMPPGPGDFNDVLQWRV